MWLPPSRREAAKMGFANRQSLTLLIQLRILRRILLQKHLIRRP